LPKWAQAKAVYLPENAIDPMRFSRLAAHAEGGPLRAAFVGRLVPYKGPDMLIEAAAPMLRDGRLVLDIVGDGPMMGDLRAQATGLGVADRVRFHGWLAHEVVQDVLASCHLFAFPSVREFGGGVVLEAMALGVPPLIVDYAGPGELVAEGRGMKVPLGARTSIVAGFAGAFERAAQDRAGLAAMGWAGRDWVRTQATWEAKARQVRAVYDAVLARTALPEVFG
jgi:glycosyltransferase involved in cell wall biosynthesis